MYPDIIVLLIVSILVGLPIGWYIFRRAQRKGEERAESVFTAIVAFILITIFSGVILFALTTEIIPDQSLFLTKQGELQEMFPDKITLWKWDERLRGVTVVSYATRKTSVIMSFSPISQNPKIRNLTYFVEVEDMGSPTAYFQYQKTIGQKSVDKWLKYYLYEFNEKYSREVAKFYNPFDFHQQMAFEKLIKDFLQFHLKDSGLRFKRAHFKLS